MTKPQMKFHVAINSNRIVRVFAESIDEAVLRVKTLSPSELQDMTVANDTESIAVNDPGEPVEFGFEHEGTWVVNPTVSECGRFVVTPDYYGFNIGDTGGGCTAWMRDVEPDMYMMVTAEDDADHKYGKRFAIGLYDKNTGDCIEDRVLEVGVPPALVSDHLPEHLWHHFKPEVLKLQDYTVCGRKCAEIVDRMLRVIEVLPNVEHSALIDACSHECNVIFFG